MKQAPTLDQVYDADFYRKQSAESARAAAQVLPLLVAQIGWPASAVLDVGCGTGAWLRWLHAERPSLALVGVDHPGLADLLATAPFGFEGRNLSEPFDLGRGFDLVISLEVAEHVDAFHANTFVDNLVRHGDRVLFSAAIPEQGGKHHVNERFPPYWIEKFERRGFRCYDTLRPLLWLAADIPFWYQQNTMLFSRHAADLALAGLRSFRGEPLVHPDLIRQRLARSRSEWRKVLRRKLLKRMGVGKYRHMFLEEW